PLLREALVAQGLIKDSGTNAASAVASANGAGQPAAEKPAAEAPATEPAASEKPAAETPAAEAAPTQRPAPEPSATTQPSATQPPAAATPTPAAGASPSNPGAAENAAAGAAPTSATTPADGAGRRAAEGGAAEGAAGSSGPSQPSAQQGISGLEGAVTVSDLSMGQRFAMDPLGNSVALVVLLLMIGVATAALSMVGRRRSRFGAGPAWWIPLLSLVGLGIALYLSFIEVSGAEAVCGPVGDCNTVQQSQYAHVLGVPVGVLGALGYVAIGLLWALAVKGRGTWRERGVAGLWAASFTGVLFSIYLTFLEPFVIGASCAWCMGSAVVMTLLLVASTGLLLQVPETAPGVAARQPPALV
ncbi:MAG: vitamin K epoxide reductase family protein, partial [Gemmatimonadota bacterium]